MTKPILLQPGSAASRTAQLLAAGWQRQTSIDEPRLSEIAQTYRALGYAVEVVMEAAVQTDKSQSASACRVCLDAAASGPRPVGSVFIRECEQALEDELEGLFDE